MSETSSSIKEIFEVMPNRLNPDVAAGMDAVIQYDLSGEGGATYHATIKDGACTVSEGSHDAPSMTLTMEASDFLDLIQGRLDGMTAFMSGKLKVGGDMALAMKAQSLFQLS